MNKLDTYVWAIMNEMHDMRSLLLFLNKLVEIVESYALFLPASSTCIFAAVRRLANIDVSQTPYAIQSTMQCYHQSSFTSSSPSACSHHGLNRLNDRRLLSSLQRLLFQQKLRIPTRAVVNPTLGLSRALPPPRSLILALRHRLRRMPIPHTLIPTIQQLIVRHVILAHIRPHPLKRPIRQRIHLDEPR